MGVPITGNFTMFGNSDNTTVQGAITEGGTDASAATTLNQLIGLSSAALFDATYAGTIINPVSDVSASLQFRGYPGLDCTLTGGGAAVTIFLPFNFTIDNGATGGTATLTFTDLANDDATLTYNNTSTETIDSNTSVPLSLTMNSGVTTGQIAVTNIDTDFAGFQVTSTNNFKINEITQWGTIKWKSLRFQNTYSPLTISDTAYPDLTRCTDLSNCFNGITSFNSSNVVGWNTSNVTDMSDMFTNATSFNQNIGSWDVSSVTTMFQMFLRSFGFNQNINTWNVSSVTNMEDMFGNATIFNNGGQALTWSSGTGTSAVTNMNGMFQNADAFNQDISSWDVSNVINMQNMFANTDSFNQNLSTWDISSVTDIRSMFSGTTNFNNGGQALTWTNGTGTSAVTRMDSVFSGATAFNQDINSWDVSNVTYMQVMFLDATSFNQDLSSWNTSNVRSFNRMFDGATSFDQNIGSWDVTSIVAFAGGATNMFGATGTSKAVTLSTANYDALLIGWAAQSVNSGILFSGGDSQYTAGGAAATARATLVTAGWTITDGGPV